MNLTTFKTEAAAKIGPLAETVRKRTRQLETLRKRLEGERGSVENLETHLAELKAAASEYLTDNAFASFKVKLKRVTVDLATGKEAVMMFERDLIPAGQRDLAAAIEKLGQAFTAACAAARADCEASMAEKLGAIVAEHDAFMVAVGELAREYGTSFHGPAPVAFSVRLAEIKRTMTGRRWLTFTRASAVAVPAATGPAAAVCVAPEALQSTRAPEVGESVKGDGPLPPEAAVVPLGAATEHPGAAAYRARALRRCAVATETPPEPAQEALQATPTDDLDAEATDKQALDAQDVDGNVEAEAPPSPTPGE